MSFSHLLVGGNPPLIASCCLSCFSFVAASVKEELLAVTEQVHCCPRRHHNQNPNSKPKTRQVSTSRAKSIKQPSRRFRAD
jgi:hypothetical protein